MSLREMLHRLLNIPFLQVANIRENVHPNFEYPKTLRHDNTCLASPRQLPMMRHVLQAEATRETMPSCTATLHL